MATYKGTKGFTVQILSSDPTSGDTAGLLFFNSTDNEFKYVTPGGAISQGTWASGGNINTARRAMSSSGSSQNAGLIFGGTIAPQVANTESYNGTSWTEVNDLNTARSAANLGVSGTQTSAIMASGETPNRNEAETWDGTNWTSVGNINSGRYSSMGLATSNTSGLICGGEPPPGTFSVNTEVWDGSSWTEVNNLNTARNRGAGVGTVTDGIVCGGQISPPNGPSTVTEKWNGTSWTEVNDTNKGTRGQGMAGTGGTSALIFGSTPSVATTEFFDGTSWTEVADLALGRASSGGWGLATAAGAAGGNPEAPGNTTAVTEEFTVPDVLIKTVTDS
jgi:hypothetical protein